MSEQDLRKVIEGQIQSLCDETGVPRDHLNALAEHTAWMRDETDRRMEDFARDAQRFAPGIEAAMRAAHPDFDPAWKVSE